ncbi:hypothetical protein [Actinomadura sp. WMMA1423]|uniref:hypothetical protein n=1 Tax=Actinomadura sp. WMMA1423 TaxID=2591108 RepID=UPI0011475C63|nr:hypothetical protein [Actinomadura sp. WMMA1423]
MKVNGISGRGDGEFTELARLEAPADGLWRRNITFLLEATEALDFPKMAWTDMAAIFGASIAAALVELAFGPRNELPTLASVVLRKQDEVSEVWRLVVTMPFRLSEEKLSRAVPGEEQSVATTMVEIVNMLSRGRWGYRIADEESVIWAEPWCT